MAEIIWKAGELVLRGINRPKLIVEEILLPNVVFPTNSGPHYRRFLIARIRNVGNERAENCLAHLEVGSLPDREFKLHWADTPYQPLRDSATKIDLEPKEARDLDVIFSVFGSKEPPKELGIIATSSPVYMSTPDPSGFFSQEPISAKGSYDVSLYRTVPSGTRINDEKESLPRSYSGAWVAMPYALYDPNGYREAFLPPGKHDISVDIQLSKGAGCSFQCTILSSKDCSGLFVYLESLKIQ